MVLDRCGVNHATDKGLDSGSRREASLGNTRQWRADDRNSMQRTSGEVGLNS